MVKEAHRNLNAQLVLDRPPRRGRVERPVAKCAACQAALEENADGVIMARRPPAISAANLFRFSGMSEDVSTLKRKLRLLLEMAAKSFGTSAN